MYVKRNYFFGQLLWSWWVFFFHNREVISTAIHSKHNQDRMLDEHEFHPQTGNSTCMVVKEMASPGGDAEQVSDCTSPGSHNLHTAGSQRNRGGTFQILPICLQARFPALQAADPNSGSPESYYRPHPLLHPFASTRNVRACVPPDEPSANACAQETEGLLTCYSQLVICINHLLSLIA